jgi:hypothetical protein
MVAVIRFPHDQTPVPAVAKIWAVRGDQALVQKHRGRRGGLRGWAKKRWVPLADIAREATARETAVGIVIDPIPPREAV